LGLAFVFTILDCYFAVSFYLLYSYFLFLCVLRSLCGVLFSVHRKGRKDRKDCARLEFNANTELITAQLFEIVLVFFQVSPEKPLQEYIIVLFGLGPFKGIVVACPCFIMDIEHGVAVPV
jgi:hypothetical protein